MPSAAAAAARGAHARRAHLFEKPVAALVERDLLSRRGGVASTARGHRGGLRRPSWSAHAPACCARSAAARRRPDDVPSRAGQHSDGGSRAEHATGVVCAAISNAWCGASTPKFTHESASRGASGTCHPGAAARVRRLRAAARGEPGTHHRSARTRSATTPENAVDAAATRAGEPTAHRKLRRGARASDTALARQQAVRARADSCAHKSGTAEERAGARAARAPRTARACCRAASAAVSRRGRALSGGMWGRRRPARCAQRPRLSGQQHSSSQRVHAVTPTARAQLSHLTCNTGAGGDAGVHR